MSCFYFSFEKVNPSLGTKIRKQSTHSETEAIYS